MNPAVLDKVSIDLVPLTEKSPHANGQVIAFDGFTKALSGKFDDEEENDENRILPNVGNRRKRNQRRNSDRPTLHGTAAGRFTEASLVKSSKNWESAGRPPMPPSLRFCRNANTLKLKTAFYPEERGRIP